MIGGTVLFTGLPASGKTTIARAVRFQLDDWYVPVVVLDGDEVRNGLSSDLGYSAADRHEQARRVGEVALLLARHDVVVLVALVCPYADDRERMAQLHERNGVPFVEVHVATAAAVCERRDAKGLWARARAGSLENFTGTDGTYERPENPDLVVDDLTLGTAVVVRFLRSSLKLPIPA